MGKPIAVTTKNFEEDVMASSIPVLIDFWAPWCNPCKALNPIIESLAEDYEGRVKVVKINTDEDPNLMQRFQIRGIPTVILIRKQDVTMRVSGVRSKKIFSEMLDDQLAGADDADQTLESRLDDDEARFLFLSTADVAKVRAALSKDPQLATKPLDGSKLNIPGFSATIRPLSLAIAMRQPQERIDALVDYYQNLSASEMAALGRADDLRELIASDKSAIDREEMLPGSPLSYAVSHGHTSCVALLLEAGADLHAGGDLMLLAMTRGDVEMLRRLQAAGLSLTDRDDPLHLAVHYGHVVLLEYLLSLGMDAALQMEDGSTPLDVCRARLARFPEHKGLLAVAKILEQHLAG